MAIVKWIQKIFGRIKDGLRLRRVVRRFRMMLDSYRLSLVMDLMELGRKKNFDIATYGEKVRETYHYRVMVFSEQVIQLKLDIIHTLFY